MNFRINLLQKMMLRALSMKEGLPGISFSATKTFKIILVIILFFCFQNPISSANQQARPNEPGPWPGIQVNTYTGNLFYQRSDLYIPTRGEIPLDINFTYNSLKHDLDKGFGNGWTFSFGMNYKLLGNDIIIFREDGQEDVFTWNGLTYDPPSGIYDALTNFEPGKFLLTSKHGIKHYFEDASHKHVTKITDRNGNAVIISYTGGKPTTITDPSGRMLNLSWVGDHLMQITDPNTSPGRVIAFQYDGSWNMIQVTRPQGNIWQYSYDAFGNLVLITDPGSGVVAISYDINEAVAAINCSPVNYSKNFTYDNCTNTTTVSQIVSLLNRQTVYTFDLSGRVTVKQFPDGSSVSYAWDSRDNLISYTDEIGGITSYSYDAMGNLTRRSDCLNNFETYTFESTYNLPTNHINKNGNGTNYSYNGNGNLISVNDCLLNSETFSYNSYGEMLTHTDKRSFTTTYNYDSYGDRTGAGYPLGLSESWTYDQVGDMLSHTNKRGLTTTYAYDLSDNLTSITDPMGYTISYAYDGNGNLSSETDQNGIVDDYTYDQLNRRIGKTRLGKNFSYSHDEAGNLTSVTDANGNLTIYTYNSRNLRTSLNDCMANSEYYSYDNAGRMLSSTDKNGNATNYQYDCLGRLTKQIDPDSFFDVYTYDPEGNKTGHTNKKGISTTYIYDCLDRLISTNFPMGYTESYTYDADGNQTSFTNRNGNITTQTFDGLGRLTTVTDPLFQTESYTYDGEGNKTSFTDKNGNITTYAYNNAGRFISVTDAAGNSESYTYDGVGNQLSMTDKRGNPAYFNYDIYNRLVSTTDRMGNTEYYSYDLMDNQLSLIDRNGYVTTHSYDCLGRLTSTTDANGYTENYGYDGVGHMTSLVDKNGAITSWTYSCCRKQSETDPLLFTESYSYDPEGNQIGITNRNGFTTTYGYDNLNRLILINSPMANQTQYVLDGPGNIIWKTDPDLNMISYSYNARNELITELYPDGSSVNYNYDNRGNLLQTINSGGAGEIVTYSYNTLNQLISKATNYGSFSKTITYSYDQNGNTSSVTTETGTISYLYDAEDQLIMVTDQNGQITWYFYDAGGKQTAIHYPNTVVTYKSYDGMGNVISVVTRDNDPTMDMGLMQNQRRPIPGKAQNPLYEIDYMIHEIIEPHSGEDLGPEEHVVVTIMNAGETVLPGIWASYCIDGGMPVEEYIPAAIPPFMPFPYMFMQTGDFSEPGHTYALSTCAFAAGDENPMNDCLYSFITHYGSGGGMVYQSFTYEYDAVGNIIWEGHEDGSNITFTFSPRNELLSSYYLPSGNLEQYAYLPGGERGSKAENGIIAIYKYNADGMLLSSGDLFYTNDNNGNRLSKTDAMGNVTNYMYGFNSELLLAALPTETVHYSYSALGNMIQRIAGGDPTFYLSSGTNILAEYDTTGSPQITCNPGISITDGALTGFNYYNGFGSATLQMDPMKNILATCSFDSFGSIIDSTGTWVADRLTYSFSIIDDLTEWLNKLKRWFKDPDTGAKVNPGTEETATPAVTTPEEKGESTVTTNPPAEEEKKVKCCGVKKFIVKWSKPDKPAYPGNLLRLDVEIEFMSDGAHDPACCEYCQNVQTSYNVKEGPHKGSNEKDPGMADDNYSRKDDTDGKPALIDPGFTTNDNPGLRHLKDDDDIDYSFTAEQKVIEICEAPCPKGAVVDHRGPHTATVSGKDPRSYTGVPATLDDADDK